MPARIVAVVGTGTGVGKTAVARRLRDALRARGRTAACVKPYVSGRGPDGTWPDLEVLECEAGAHFLAPLSPLAAVQSGEPPVDPAEVLAFVNGKAATQDGGWLLVEGIGGVLVPLAPAVTWLDWHAGAGWPTVVVGAAGLGTINHTLLTLEALRSRHIPVAGFILSETVPSTRAETERNSRIIAEFSGVVPLGILHYDAKMGVAGRWEDAVAERLEGTLG